MEARAVYLAQTDTTAGLLSQDFDRLSHLKGRPEGKPMLLSVDSLRRLKEFARVPLAFRNLIRRSQRSSFVYPNNQGIRVVKDPRHRRFLERFGYLYSTSANRSGEGFALEFAYDSCDVMVYEGVEIGEGKPSSIWRLGRSRRRKIRG